MMAKAPGRWRSAAAQALVFALVGLALLWVFAITGAELRSRGIETGFAFLGEPARTALANAPFAFTPGEDSNALALWAGALNTLKISAMVIVLASILGLGLGLGRLSRNRLLRGSCLFTIELVRNVPVLIHISLSYALVLSLPAPREAQPVLGVLVTNRGLYLPSPVAEAGWLLSGLCGLIACLALIFLRRRGGRWSPGSAVMTLLTLAAMALPWLVLGRIPDLSTPAVAGFRINGGVSISPELAAFVIALTLYTSTFLAEIIRGAIQSVPRGQWEATMALALPGATVRRSVIYPQAIRVALPAMANEYIGVIKNSSLAVVIGYQEIVGIGNTVLFDTGQAVEVMAVIAGFFILVSLGFSGLMNLVNTRLSWGDRR
ncbi:ABC transporter permease subunit [Pararhodobacter aggregans]|uniref:Amino acid ABC transporter permease n=2 Tax=Pararhodobacter aggregans TaxID=404875 RepID=A0A2T7UK76_9RHOB|nr:ABC transporter permease subunit [Pararhodobacter aggregans]PTX03240.1 general L-amino acid transport system permease protein [Pararhodobacter aggregans]PVE45081.1 amino acid ABC transporter permease [Pararhodobacter aggregans]